MTFLAKKKKKKKCHHTVVADPLLAAHFRQPSARAALDAVVAARSSDRRTVQCSADRRHWMRPKQGYCASRNKSKQGYIAAKCAPEATSCRQRFRP